MYISQHRYVPDVTSHDSFIKQHTLGRQFGILENDINGRTAGQLLVYPFGVTLPF